MTDSLLSSARQLQEASTADATEIASLNYVFDSDFDPLAYTAAPLSAAFGTAPIDIGSQQLGLSSGPLAKAPLTGYSPVVNRLNNYHRSSDFQFLGSSPAVKAPGIISPTHETDPNLFRQRLAFLQHTDTAPLPFEESFSSSLTWSLDQSGAHNNPFSGSLASSSIRTVDSLPASYSDPLTGNIGLEDFSQPYLYGSEAYQSPTRLLQAQPDLPPTSSMGTTSSSMPVLGPATVTAGPVPYFQYPEPTSTNNAIEENPAATSSGPKGPVSVARDQKSPYAGHVSQFRNVGEARAHRFRIRGLPRFTHRHHPDAADEFDETVDEVRKDWDFWKEKVFASMISLDDVSDKKTAAGYRHFSEQFYDVWDIEGRACELVELCVELHVNGSRLDNWHSLARANSADHELKCRERLERVCDILAKEKMACENVMAGTDAIRRLIIAPIASEKRKIQNRRGNSYKSEELKLAKAVKAVGGGPRALAGIFEEGEDDEGEGDGDEDDSEPLDTPPSSPRAKSPVGAAPIDGRPKKVASRVSVRRLTGGSAGADTGKRASLKRRSADTPPAGEEVLTLAPNTWTGAGNDNYRVTTLSGSSSSPPNGAKRQKLAR